MQEECRITIMNKRMFAKVVLAILITTTKRTSSVGLGVTVLDVGSGATTDVLASHSFQIPMSTGHAPIAQIIS